MGHAEEPWREVDGTKHGCPLAGYGTHWNGIGCTVHVHCPKFLGSAWFVMWSLQASELLAVCTIVAVIPQVKHS